MVTKDLLPQRPEDKEKQKDAVRDAGERTDFYVLKGSVLETTWMRIKIDHDEPREFLFQPGSKPQWKAKEGFDLIVGNAAGMEFDFNGKKLVKLGNLGQVVRLRLPEGFNPTGSED